MDQWGVAREAGAGRALYAADILRTCEELSVHWVYWNGRQFSRSGGATFGLLALHREASAPAEAQVTPSTQQETDLNVRSQQRATGWVRLDWDLAMLSQLKPFLGEGPRRTEPIPLGQ